MCTKACSSLSCLTNEKDSCWQLRLTTPKFCLTNVNLFLVCWFAVPNPLFNFNFVMQAQLQVVKPSTARGLCSGVECFQQQWSCLCLGTVVLQLCCQSSLPATGVADTQSWSAAGLPCYTGTAAHCCSVTLLRCHTVATSRHCSATLMQCHSIAVPHCCCDTLLPRHTVAVSPCRSVAVLQKSAVVKQAHLEGEQGQRPVALQHQPAPCHTHQQ